MRCARVDGSNRTDEREEAVIIGIPIYQKVDLLDVAAPVEIFASMKSYVPQLGIEIYLIAEDKREVVTRAGVTTADSR